MSSQSKIDKILECYRTIKSLQEMMGAGAAGGGMTTQSSAGKAGFSSAADSSGPVAGTDTTVDFRKKKYKKLNMFYRSVVKPTPGAKNGGKGD
jgi:hypothetical protein